MATTSTPTKTKKRGLNASSSATEKTKKVIDYTKNNYLGILITGGVVLALYLATKVTSGVSDAVEDVLDFNPGNEEGAGGSAPLAEDGDVKPIGATITPNQAKIIAGTLYEAMVVWNGTDEGKIYQALAGKNQIDFTMISNAFGEPRYDGMGEAFWPFPKRNLTFWLNSELKEAEMQQLKIVMPGVLPGSVKGNVSKNPLGQVKAKQYADQLYALMKETWKLDTAQTTTVFNILMNKTEAQFQEIRTAFGTKSYNTLTNNQSFPFYENNPPLMNLPTWLKNELSSANYSILQAKFPTHLK